MYIFGPASKCQQVQPWGVLLSNDWELVLITNWFVNLNSIGVQLVTLQHTLMLYNTGIIPGVISESILPPPLHLIPG